MGGGEHLTSKLEKYIGEAIENIRKDREVTNELLTDLIQFIAKNEQNHKDVGLTAAKYVEKLQRSNEQLVKLTSIMAKKADTSVELSEDDKRELFDVIQGEK